MTRGTFRRWVGRGLSAVTIIMLIALLWPMRFGGWSSFIVVRGESMEPAYHLGDLLYVRSTSDYAPGDIAVYRNPKGAPGAGTLVVHRILARNDDGTFQFKGDNRDLPDDLHVRPSDLVGQPVRNLGAGPTHLLGILPIMMSVLFGLAVARAVWPQPPEALTPQHPAP